MITTHQLSEHEKSLVQTLSEENKTTLATIGSLMLQLETAKKQLEVQQERERSILNMAVQRLGISQFRQARLDNGTLVVETPDESAVVPSPQVVNGAARESTT